MSEHKNHDMPKLPNNEDTVRAIGKPFTTPMARDAIHIAVAPVVAGETLRPGEIIGFVRGRNDGTVSSDHMIIVKFIGIVDPYLKKSVHVGQRFFMFLYPGSITSLRHDWAHPAFAENDSEVLENKKNADEEALQQSKLWMCELADDVNMSYDKLIQGGIDYVQGGSYLVGGGSMEGRRTPDEFWPHFERITGIKVPEKDRESFFSCSC